MTVTSPTSATRPRRRWRTWLLALLIFIGGAMVGSAFTAGAIFRSVRHAIAHPEEAPQRITARLTRRLDLTSDQAAKVRELIAARQASLLELRRDVQPRVDAELDALEREIAAVLNPKQQLEWRELAATFRRTWLPPPPGTTTGMPLPATTTSP